MKLQEVRKLVILVVLDGWGIAPENEGNAVSKANTHNMKRFWASYPHTQLGASGEAVGLPRGEDGNSETGHINLGAGKIVYQYLARINMSIADGSFFENKALVGAIEHAKKNNSDLHLMGLVGSGGVHSNVEHLYALIQLAGNLKFKNVKVHVFTDGRDSPPNVAEIYIRQLKEVMEKEGVGEIASVMGRYWAMDRDRRWERTAKAYLALTRGEGNRAASAEEAVRNSYAKGATDEFIEPTMITSEGGNKLGIIKENDAVIFFNFRIDRPRQLTRAFLIPDLTKDKREWGFDPYQDLYQKGRGKVQEEFEIPRFKRGERIGNLYFCLMTEYEKPLTEAGAKVAYLPEVVEMPLGRVISTYDMRQLRVAESEKERFVTYYFNGRREEPFPGEDRIIVPSPKVATYDLKPEMSSYLITEELMGRIKEEEYNFVFVNYAAPDMVAHSGNMEAAKKAVEAVDECVGKIGQYVLGFGGSLMITADHGNVEEMINTQTGEVDTEHSNNPVPFVVISNELLGKSQMLQSGILGDVAPTVLGSLGIEKPSSMMGRDLLKDIRG